MWPLSATTRQAERSTMSPTTSDSRGSIGIQFVVRITIEATTAATEPNRSPTTCSAAARMLRLSCVAAAQYEEHDHVDGEAGEGNPQHRRAVHFDGARKPSPGFDPDPDGDGEQCDAVDERHEHGEPVEAVGAAPVGGPPREPEGKPRERQAREVGQHVARVCEQREGAGEHAADDLGEHESAREHRRKTHAALVGAVRWWA